MRLRDGETRSSFAVEERVRNRKSVRVAVVQVWGVRVLVG
jgi:hypothetical protein